MQRLLFRRIPRSLRSGLLSYAALGLLIGLCVFIIISVIAAGITVIEGTEKAARENAVEDGHFSVFEPLSQEELSRISRQGIAVEPQFYLDFTLSDGSMLRIFENRRQTDLFSPDTGRIAEREGEIALEKKYCEKHGIQAGDILKVGPYSFTVCAVGSTPDYDCVLKELSDTAADSMAFGTAFVTKEAYLQLLNSGESTHAQEYVYAYRYTDRSLSTAEKEVRDRTLKDALKELSCSGGEAFLHLPLSALLFLGSEVPNLTSFFPAAQNARIMAAADDVAINVRSCYAAGVILLILLSYIISVFVIHQIDREKQVIGALYALGVSTRDLLLHYILLPVFVTLLCGTTGLIIGISPIGVQTQMLDSTGYYSIPELPVVLSPALVLYGVVMPPLVAALVNYLVIRRKLSRPALQMLRGQETVEDVVPLRIRRLPFLRLFRIRQLLRELRSELAILFGVFIALLVLMIGLDCYTYCENVRVHFIEDTRYEYMYTFKYPLSDPPPQGHTAFAKTLSKDFGTYSFDVTVLGLGADDPYFGVPKLSGKDSAVVSSSFAIKYRLSRGDTFTLKDRETDSVYSFRIEDIVRYSPAFTVFLDIRSAQELFGESDDYYNVLYADAPVQIPANRLYATTTRADIEKAASVFIDFMMPLVRTLTLISALVLVIVIFLMMKVMLDRSAYHISVVKLFGFRDREIRRMYLDGNLFVILISAAICIPLSKQIMDIIFPYFVENVACGEDLSFTPAMYAAVFALILISFFLSEFLLLSGIRRTKAGDILKNRE